MMGHGMDREKEFVDPPRALRRYYRHHQTGDLGYIVTVDGREHIKYDRPNDFSTVPFKEQEWKEEPHAEPLGRAQAASVAFEADRVLCGFLGLPLEMRKEWRMLSHRQRTDFVAVGPKGDPSRERMYAAILSALADITRPE